MSVLCLSLGHNSSAVYVSDSGDIIGYETERLTRVKSDSAFPIAPIMRMLNETDLSPDLICISHWFDNFDPYTTENKYYSAMKIGGLFPDADIKACSVDGVSHHDAHAFSAHAFAGEEFIDNTTLTVVVDGFGTGQEIASAYRNQLLVSRLTGYFYSMGLLYQHAAEVCDMDGINDVYKFLGYRVHLPLQDRELCDSVTKNILGIMLPIWSSHELMEPQPHPTDLFDRDLFMYVKNLHKELFSPLVDKSDMFRTRVRVGYVVQEVLEECVLKFISVHHRIRKLVLVGGCFLNVRLNDQIRKKFRSTKICVMPLAGDQGAALGLAHMQRSLPSRLFDSLCWGKRKFISKGGKTIETLPVNNDTIKQIGDELASGMIVNICYGDMEFGPRALCHTSTLALPTRELVDAINTANGRTTVMPMAPVIPISMRYKYFGFDGLDRTHKSDKYMITAHEYLRSVDINEIIGAAHEDIDGSFSGRPQFIDRDEGYIGPLFEYLVKEHGIFMLINTSLNIHGQPIVYDFESLVVTVSHWLDHCPVLFKTYILKD